MKSKLIKPLVALTFITSPTAFSVDASAVRSMVYAGAECKRHSGSNSYDYRAGLMRRNSTS